MKYLTSLALCLITMTSTLIAQQQTRTLDDFHAVAVAGGITATLVKSNTTSIDIEMIKGDIDDLITKVEGGRLKVKFKSKMGWGNNNKANVTIHYTAFDEVDASAGSSIKSNDVVTASRLSVDASSGANINLEIESKMVKTDCSSGAHISLKGTAEEATYDVSSGATIELVANKSLKAEASSGGSIEYIGNPTNVDIDSGKYSGGTVRKK